MNFSHPTPRLVGALCFFFACLVIAPASRAATNAVSFNLAVWSTAPVANKRVKITPHPSSFPRAEGEMIISVDPIYTNSGASGTFTVSNMVTGTYIVEFTNLFRNTTFQITLPSTNANSVLTAAELTTSGTNDPSNLAAYTQAAANSRFAMRTNAISQISTAGVRLAFGVTNINWTTGVTGYQSGATAFLGITASGSGNGVTNLNANQFSDITTIATIKSSAFLTNTVMRGSPTFYGATIGADDSTTVVNDGGGAPWNFKLFANSDTNTVARIHNVNFASNYLYGLSATLDGQVDDLQGATNGLDARVTSLEGMTNSFQSGTNFAGLILTNAFKRSWLWQGFNTNQTIDWSKTNHVILQPSNTVTIAFANTPAAGSLAQELLLEVYNTNSTSATIVFPSSIDWGSASPVYLVGTNFYKFRFSGTNIYGFSGQELSTGSGPYVLQTNATIYLNLPTNTFLRTGAGGIVTTGTIGSGLSMSAGGTLSATTTSSAFNSTNLYVSNSSAVVADLANFDRLKVYAISNGTIHLSNASSFLKRGRALIQQSTNGLAAITWSVPGGLLQTNGNIGNNTNANALDVLEFEQSFHDTNLFAWWPSNFLPRVAFTNSLGAAGGSTPPSVVSVFGTNAAVQNGQFTNSIDAAATFATITVGEFNGVITGVFLTNTANGSGGAASLFTRTNCTTGSDFMSTWQLANPPTGASIEVTFTAAGNRFPTFLVVGYKNATSLDTAITLDNNGTTARPGITNTVAGASGQLGVIVGAAVGFTSLTATGSGEAAVGQFIGAGGDYDIFCATNAAAATTTLGYTSDTTAQSAHLFIVKP